MGLFRGLAALGWPFTVYWLLSAFEQLRYYPDTSLGYENGLGAVLFVLSFVVFGLIFIIPGKVLQAIDSQSTRDQELLVVYVAALVLALFLDMLLRWYIRRACVPRTSGSPDDWMA